MTYDIDIERNKSVVTYASGCVFWVSFGRSELLAWTCYSH